MEGIGWVESRGVAYRSGLQVVKMEIHGKIHFPRTTELMGGIDYLIRQAVKIENRSS